MKKNDGSNRAKVFVRVFCGGCLFGLAALAAAQERHGHSLPDDTGRADFVRACAACHTLEIATSRRETAANWSQIVQTMVAHGALLDKPQAAAVTQYLAAHFGVGGGGKAYTSTAAAPKPGAVASRRPMQTLPPPPGTMPVNPLSTYTAVTDAMLRSPAAGDWLNWRRTYDDQGFSPLKTIRKDNIRTLRLAWSFTLPNGPNEGTPLVHDGVLFTQAYGDAVFAVNAATGDLLWKFSRELAAAPFYKKNLALHGKKVIAATSDGHVIALDAMTGRVIWDRAVTETAGILISGGPLVAAGKVMIGTKGSAPGGNFILGLDVETGAESWRFHTIAQPGEPGGESWNGLDADQRNGGSVWTAGSFDVASGLAYFGVAPTYDTGPLRIPVEKRGVSNDALYTDSTVALDPATGRLAWHFQHMANDQWDMDWAYERIVADLEVDGKRRRLAITAGKPAIYDAVDAATGRYVFSKDLGVQNLITAIDPKTGAKTINPDLFPRGQSFFMCPYLNSGKEWLPAAYSAKVGTLFVGLTEFCVNFYPLEKGQKGLLTGYGFQGQPHPDSDGKFGRLVALDLKTRETSWVVRQRAPFTTGVLATAGGLLFVGSADRRFAARDADTGRLLWETRLGDVPSSAPISFEADGKQFVAVVAGCCGVQARDAQALLSEAKVDDHASSITVFELMD